MHMLHNQFISILIYILRIYNNYIIVVNTLTHAIHAIKVIADNESPIMHKITPALALPSSGLSFFAWIPITNPIIASIIPIKE